MRASSRKNRPTISTPFDTVDLMRASILIAPLLLTAFSSLAADESARKSSAAAKDANTPPLKALLITGGCCHDYKNQIKILTESLSARVRVEWKVVHGPNERKKLLDVYAKDDWAKGFDVIVHNECYGAVDDIEYVERIARAHFEGTAGVAIHCSMHSYRAAATDEWRKCLGVTSRRHERHRPVEVKRVAKKHPVLRGFPDTWKTPKGELYMIEKVWPEAEVLCTAWGADTKKDHPVVWTNTYGAGRMFVTTLGHHNETMSEKVYLDLVARGLLWACDKLDKNGNPLKEYVAKPAGGKSGSAGEKPAGTKPEKDES